MQHQRRKAYTGTGVMVAFYVPARPAALLSRLARRTLGEAAEPAEDMHLTLAYLGKTDDPALDKATVLAALTAFVQATPPPARLDVAGAKTFDTVQDDGTIPVYAAVAKTPELLDFRAALVAALEDAGVPVSKDFATYTPHITLGYVAPEAPTTLPRVPRLAFAAGPVWLGWGGELIPIVPEGVTTKPFRSQAQWAWAFANGQPWARRWAHETPGGKGTRFRKLPRKKKVATLKAPNYGARAGQVIQGNLARGGDGQFTSAGSASAAPAKPKKAPKRRPTRKPKKPTLSPEQRQVQRQQERDAQRRENEATVGQDGGLGSNLSDALLEFASPGEAITLAPQNKAELERRGLVETGPDGSTRISQAGRAYVDAARSGDVSRARDALSRASERRTRADERASTAQQRQQERAARRAELEKRRAERAATPKKGGGGKGGGKGKQPKSGDTETVARQLEEGFGRMAQLLRAGKTLDEASRFVVFKDAKGQWRWITLTSVGYEDRDEEIVSTKALAADCDRADGDGQYGPLRWWHVGQPDPANADAPWGPGLDLGWCDFNAMSDKCLIESGTFTSPVIAEGLAAKADTLGVSPGFFHPPDEPAPDGTFASIRRFERSLAPHSVVANPFTRFSAHKEHRMDQEKLKALATLVGLSEDDVRQHVSGMTATAHKAAADAGVRFKTTDEPPQPGQRFKAGDGTEYVKSPSPLDPLGAHYAVKAPDPVEAEKAPPAVAAAEVAADMAEDAADAAVDEAEEESFLTEGDLDRIATRVADKLMAALSTITGKVGELDEQMKQYGYARTKTAEEAAQQRQQLEQQIATLTQQQAQAAATLKTAQEQLAQLRGEQPGQQPHVASTSADTALPGGVAQAIKTVADGSTQEVQPKAAETLAWLDAVVSGRPPQSQPPAI